MTPTALAVPPIDADAATVRSHFIAVGHVFASVPYDVQTTLCQTLRQSGRERLRQG